MYIFPALVNIYESPIPRHTSSNTDLCLRQVKLYDVVPRRGHEHIAVRLGPLASFGEILSVGIVRIV